MVGKTDLDSMLGESGFGAATEMGGFALEIPRRILGTITLLDIHLNFISIGRSICQTIRLNYFFLFWFPKHKAINTNITLAAISPDPVLCLFECLGPIPTRRGGIEKRKKIL